MSQRRSAIASCWRRTFRSANARRRSVSLGVEGRRPIGKTNDHAVKAEIDRGRRIDGVRDMDAARKEGDRRSTRSGGRGDRIGAIGLARGTWTTAQTPPEFACDPEVPSGHSLNKGARGVVVESPRFRPGTHDELRTSIRSCILRRRLRGSSSAVCGVVEYQVPVPCGGQAEHGAASRGWSAGSTNGGGGINVGCRRNPYAYGDFETTFGEINGLK